MNSFFSVSLLAASLVSTGNAEFSDLEIFEYPPVELRMYAPHPRQDISLKDSGGKEFVVTHFNNRISEGVKVVPPVEIQFGDDPELAIWNPDPESVVSSYFLILSLNEGSLHISALPSEALRSDELGLLNLSGVPLSGKVLGDFVEIEEDSEVQVFPVDRRFLCDLESPDGRFHCEASVDLEGSDSYLLLITSPFVEGSGILRPELIRLIE